MARYDLGTQNYVQTPTSIVTNSGWEVFKTPLVVKAAPNGFVVAYGVSRYTSSIYQSWGIFYWDAGNAKSYVNDRVCAAGNSTTFVASSPVCPSLTYNAPAVIGESPRLVIENDRALIAWRVDNYSGGSYYAGRTLDLTSNAFVGAEQRIATSNSGNQGGLDLIGYNNKVLAVWHTSHSGTNDIRGNFWDLNALTQTSQDFPISTLNSGDQKNPRIAANNGKAFIVWESNDDGVTYDINGRIYDLAQNVFLGNDMLINTSKGNTQSVPFVATSGSKMLTAWQSYDDLSTWRIRTRLFDLSVLQALPYGPNHFFTAPLIERNFDATAKIVR